jgi:hypothetical protein
MSVGVMSCEGFKQCGARYEGHAKDLGVSYPQGVTVTEPPEVAGFYIAASNKKEDIWVAKIPFSKIPKHNGGSCGAFLKAQHSEASCEAGKSFGFHKSNCSMWVDVGCDADFLCNGKPLRCSSKSFARADCQCEATPGCCSSQVFV